LIVRWTSAGIARLGRLVGGEARSLAAVERVSQLDQSADDVSRTATRLSYSVYAMLGWISLVTVAIAAVAVVTLRRRRRPEDEETERRDWTRSLADIGSVGADDEMSSCASSSQVISVSD